MGRTISTYSLMNEDLEDLANTGKELTLEFLEQNGFISSEQAAELSKTLLIIRKKKSLISKFFNWARKEKEEPIFFMTKLTEVLEVEENPQENSGENE